MDGKIQMNRIKQISREMKLSEPQVSAVHEMLEQGATIPFMARYRKERTGSLDEVAITLIRDRLVQLGELADRKKSILKSLEERDFLRTAFRWI